RLGDERLAVTLDHLGGQVLFERADYAAAAAQLERVVAACRRLGHLELLPTALTTLGLVYRFQGDMAAAPAAWAQAIAPPERLRGRGRPELGMSLPRLARLEGAEPHHEGGIRGGEGPRRIAVQGYGATSQQAGIVTEGLGESLLYGGDYAGALALAE